MIPEKIFTSEYILVTIISFFISTNFFLLLSAIPRYSLEILHLSETNAGIASGFLLVGMMVSRLIAGIIVNKAGFKKTLVVWISVLAAATLGYFFAESYELLLIVRFLNGFAFGIVANTKVTIITTIIPRSRSAEGVGYYSMFNLLAWAVGPFIAVELSRAGYYDAVFLISAVLPSIGLVLIPFVRMPSILSDPKHTEMERGVLNRIFYLPVVPIAITTGFFGLFVSNITSFISVFSETIGLGSFASSYFLIYVTFLIVTRPAVSRMIDKRGPNIVFFPGAILSLFGFVVLSQAESAFMLFISAAIIGVGFGATQNVALALVVKTTPPYKLAIANATFYLVLDIANAAGPMLGGMLIENIGFRQMYMCGAYVVACALLWYFFFLSKKAKNL